MADETFSCSFSFILGQGATFSHTDSSKTPKLQLSYPKSGPVVNGLTASITASVEKI